MTAGSSNGVDIPDHLLEHFMQYFVMFRNDTDDFREPHLRRSVVYVYPLFIFLYAVIVIVGTVSNVAVIVTIVRRRLYRNPTYFFVCNLALSDIVKCLVVLPATLAVLLIQNWIFGSFLCYFIPMMQDIPIHASTLTFVMIAVDRYRLITYSMASRLPRFLCVLGVWVLAVCVVLPYVFYIRYFDFEDILGPQVTGAGLCTVNIEDDMEEYVRGMFIALYVLPLTIVAFLYVRVGGELKAHESPLSTVLFEMSSTDERTSHSTGGAGGGRSGSDTPCPTRGSWSPFPADAPPPNSHSDNKDIASDSLKHYGYSNWRREYDDDLDQLDIRKEKRTQKYLITMVTLYAMCLCPLKILGLAKHVVFETYDNAGHFDLAFITFVWIGFLSTCTTPVLFASWRMSRPTKDRLRGYFRFSNRRRHSSATANSLQVVNNPPNSTQKHRRNGGGQSNEGYSHSLSTPLANHLGVVNGKRSDLEDKRRSETRSKSLV